MHTTYSDLYFIGMMFNQEQSAISPFQLLELEPMLFSVLITSALRKPLSGKFNPNPDTVPVEIAVEPPEIPMPVPPIATPLPLLREPPPTATAF
jgi:hypothetical protein